MEIERKWRIRPEDIPYNLSSLKAIQIEQAYISFSPVVRVRNINQGEKYILTVKRPTEFKGLASLEDETEIDEQTYRFLRSVASGNIISKTRYLYPLPSGLLEEIDIFSGDLQGLAYLEIEFPDRESAAAFPSPGWVMDDVTYKPEYKNSSLAQHGLP